MERALSLPVQQLIHASERVMAFVANHNGLPKDDCEAVLLYAYGLIREIEPHYMERHQHDTLNKRLV